MPDRGRALNEKSKAMRGEEARARIGSDRLAAPPPIETIFRVSNSSRCAVRALPTREIGAQLRKLRLVQSPDSIGSKPRSARNLTEPVEIHWREPEAGCGCLRAIRNTTRQVDRKSKRKSQPERSIRPPRGARGTGKQSRLVRFIDAFCRRGWRRARRRVFNLATMPGCRAESRDRASGSRPTARKVQGRRASRKRNLEA